MTRQPGGNHKPMVLPFAAKGAMPLERPSEVLDTMFIANYKTYASKGAFGRQWGNDASPPIPGVSREEDEDYLST